jgi:hypothetical protein
MIWFTSSDCGASWSATQTILPNMTAEHTVAGGFRTSLLPASAMDGAGAIYAVWQTRSFRTQNTNLAASASAAATCVRLVNISGLAAGQTVRIDPNGAHPEVVTIAMSVMPAPTNGNPAPSFGPPARIPIEGDSGGQSNPNDHFVPGIGADPNTSGSWRTSGSFARVGYVSSPDSGAHWTAPTYLASMTLAEIARSSQGPMVGDYATADVISAGPCRGRAIESFAVGLAPEPADNALAERMFAPTCGLRIGSDGSVLPATKPPGGRAPVLPPSLHRTAH